MYRFSRAFLSALALTLSKGQIDISIHNYYLAGRTLLRRLLHIKAAELLPH
jgi:hypothetical protein